MFTRMKERLLEAARGPHALRALAVVSFIESSIFPIPPDVMLIPMVLADRKRAILIATVCTIASVLGGLAGYGIGYFAFEALGQPLLSLYGKADLFESFKGKVQAMGFGPHFLATLGAAVTPFPYKVLTISAGALQLSLAAFIIASVIGRGLRFYAEAIMLSLLGARASAFIEQRFGLILTVFFVLLVAGFVALRLMH